MRILVACEESQAVTKELRKLGHEAYSCDIQECSGGHPEWHILQDVREVLGVAGKKTVFILQTGRTGLLEGEWDMIIAFPPCTYLSNAGACRLYPKKGQLDKERYKKGSGSKSLLYEVLQRTL